MGDLFVVEFGDDDDRSRRRAEQEAERARIRGRYVGRLTALAGLDALTADQVMAVLFDHHDADGALCPCGCHPQLSSLHDDGQDCRCTWSAERRAAEHRSWLDQWRNSEWAKASRTEHEAEERLIAEWVAGQVDVVAKRLTSYAPEQWEGTVDGHSFYFRERHGDWRIELDLQPSGRNAQRVVDTSTDGGFVTEPVELTEGELIAEGVEGALGATPVEHLDFIVRTIREHLWRQSCQHEGALLYCPQCGLRM